MSEGKELPEGWVQTTLGDVLPIQYGKGLVDANRDKNGQIPVYGSSGIVGFHNQALTSNATLIVGRKGSVGSVYYSPVPCWPIDTTYFTEENANVDLKFFLYLISFLQLNRLDTSTAIPGLSRDDYNAAVVKIAPLAEQHRIVAAIEQQFTRLDAGIASLQQAKAKLKSYRVAVLKAAVEGKLTEEWRAEHPDIEPASELLERILIERRAKWEAEQLAKMEARGVVPKDDKWKESYKEPAQPDREDLLELPEGWGWAGLEQCSRRITDGTHQPPQFTKAGIPFIFVTHIVKGSISFENTKYISQSTYQQLNTRCPVEYGDILYSAVGSYGVAVPVLTYQPFSFQRHIAHIKPSTLLAMSYLIFCLNSSICLDQAHQVARGVAQKTVTLTDLARFVIPLAPLNEQEQIVAEVERRLSIISQLEAAVDTNLKRAEQERQSILQEAFAGHLVAQDPNDEPASILLERIQEERVKQEKEEQQRRKEARMNEQQRKKARKTPTDAQSLPLHQVLLEVNRPITADDLLRELNIQADTLDDFHDTMNDFYRTLRDEMIKGRIRRIPQNYERDLLEAVPE